MDYSIDFTGKTALVVGGTSGIGNATAQAFRTKGADVHVWGTRQSPEDYENEPTSDLAGIRYECMDVVESGRVESYAPPFSKLDVLVLCQGLVLYERKEFETEGFSRVLDVNLTSLMTCAMKFRDLLSQSNGSLIIVSSSAAFHATRGNPAYNASKAGALGLTRTLAQAWAAEGIRVNGIAPGFVPTRMTRVTTENEKRADAARSNIPLGRFGTPEEMAAIALFLASPMSGYIVGQTLLADGGMLL
ncbi:SDR family NAD(P)-dependent oxidoreductase [Henriciella aquimarina]|uniref:SDR family NAD(P)-dependent oxidoreductase n=1 Tax=Henriciella aquimarina TaxID=545261 RepID=UPI0009FE9192|nr:SDR family oxidoreductase [Henriciella aquimarina]